MPEQPTYPHFVHDARLQTYLRYNSPTWVCQVGPTQLQVLHLRAPRLLYSGQAVPCAEAEFRAAAQATYTTLLAACQQPAGPATAYQRRRTMPDAWYYRQDSPQRELRLNLSHEENGPISVNWLLEDLATIPGLVVAGPPRSSDPRRVASTSQEYHAALALAIPALMAAAQGKPA